METSAFPYAVRQMRMNRSQKRKAKPREKPSALFSPSHGSLLVVVILWAPDLARRSQLSLRRTYFAMHGSPLETQQKRETTVMLFLLFAFYPGLCPEGELGEMKVQPWHWETRLISVASRTRGCRVRVSIQLLGSSHRSRRSYRQML